MVTERSVITFGEINAMKALIIIGDIAFSMKTGRQEAVILPVGDGQCALETAETSAPDLVILDSSLPGMKLLDLITRLRQVSDAPILVLAESESDRERLECLEAGADKYLRSWPEKEKLAELVHKGRKQGHFIYNDSLAKAQPG
jgi:DNA-binding NarL/FixJ family response regulator